MRLSEAIRRHRSGSTLAQVMACCLTAPSHYLNQSWLIINGIQWHTFDSKFTEITQPSITKINFKVTHVKFHSNLPEANEFILLTYRFYHQQNMSPGALAPSVTKLLTAMILTHSRCFFFKIAFDWLATILKKIRLFLYRGKSKPTVCLCHWIN